MTSFDETMELNESQLNGVSGGAGYKPLMPRPGFSVYQIRPGDTLTGIAETHRCTVEQLMAWNPKIKDPDLIYAGDYLYVKI